MKESVEVDISEVQQKARLRLSDAVAVMEKVKLHRRVYVFQAVHAS